MWLISNVSENSNTRPLCPDIVPLNVCLHELWEPEVEMEVNSRIESTTIVNTCTCMLVGFTTQKQFSGFLDRQEV